ncbi:MAG: FecR domain-containing protein [Alphaproteobacteria bacterium]|nr:FecR domain-containing protein [Alphaproteobacteria bacterium]
MNAQSDPKSLALTKAAQTPQAAQKPLHLVSPENGWAVQVPKASLLTQGDYARQGLDLLITGPDGEQVLVTDYFLTDSPPDLVAEDGARIAGSLAETLAGPMAPGQYAQAGAGGASRLSIGQVETLNGSVNVIHADGSKGVLHKGDAVFQGDVMQTAKGASVGVLFVDKTSMSLGGEGRMVLDQMVFDPSSGTGKSAFSLVQGTFSFVSGQISKSSPDAMVVRTPVATIGIRGTLGSGGYTPAQGLTVAVLSEGANGVGEVTISNAAGTQTINTANSAIMVTSFFNAPPPAFSFTAQQFASSSLAQVLSSLPATSASPGAAQAVQQIQNMAPAAQAPAAGGPAAPQTGPQAPGAAGAQAPGTPGAPGAQAPGTPGEAAPAAAQGEGQPGGGAAPQAGGVAFGLIAVGATPPGGPAGPAGPAGIAGQQTQAAQMFSAAAQVAIDQALAGGASIEQAQAAAMNVQAAFNTAMSQGAPPQQALAAAGQAAMQVGLLTAAPPAGAAGGAPGAGGGNINPFAVMATGQGSVSNTGIMVMGAGPGQGPAAAQAGLAAMGAAGQAAMAQGATIEQAGAANRAAANAAATAIAGGANAPQAFGAAAQAGIATAIGFGATPEQAAAGAAAAQAAFGAAGGFGTAGGFGAPGGGFGPTSFFGSGGAGTFSGATNQMGVMSFGAMPGGFNVQQMISQGIAGAVGNFGFDQISSQIAAQVAAQIAAQIAAQTTFANLATYVDNSGVTSAATSTTVFADTLFGTTGSDALVGGSANTDFVISQAALGGADVLTDSGTTTSDRITFTNLALVKLILQDSTSGDGYVNGTAAPMSASGGSLVAGVAYDTAISISTAIEDIQASTGTLSEGVVLTNAMKSSSSGGIVDNPGNYGYIVAGTASGSSTADVIDASVTSAGYFPSPIGSILFGLDGGDTITGTAQGDVVYGDTGADTIRGMSGNDSLYGGADDDVISPDTYTNVGGTTLGGFGNDAIYGGDGNDTLDYSAVTVSVTVDLANSYSQMTVSGTAYTDTVNSIELVYGGTNNDTLTGTTGNDTFYGGSGADTLIGQLGADFLQGGGGCDTLYGGLGSDTFVYTSTSDCISSLTDAAFTFTAGSYDSVNGFVSGADKIRLTSSGFGSLSNLTTNTNFFTIGSAFNGTNSGIATQTAYLVVDSTNTLYYDADYTVAGYTVIATADASIAIGDIEFV